ncbi:phage tail protein [Aeromonas veronii]|uniref:phage tail-collar fiber domain-containing protein n=1 Tax=Aeromonas veronii TaxID=654 RepID=UPI00130252B0|nr:phage tail protein [Aeromonas veronii]KAE9637400.1 hypothetical protein GO977_00135 [Aeromonas veronii]
MNYYAVLTDHGAQLIEQAYQHGQVVTITQMAIGDGGGVELEPATSALAVAGEFDRVPLTSGASASSMLGGGVDYESQAHVGKWIRTLGLMDAQGNLIVYSNYPPTYIADKGSTLFRTLGLNIQLPIVHGDAVTVIVERPPYPPATYTEQGVTRFATKEETLAGEKTTIAVAPKEMAAAINAHYLAAGTPLPTANIGPIWHDDYHDWMTWQTFNQNGANYTGYASRLIGSLLLDTQPTPRAGYIKSGVQNLGKTTYAALRAWAMHNGRMVAPGAWQAGAIQCADNSDGTTFRVFDVRGEYLRAFDDGRGVNNGRLFGSWAAGAIADHFHSLRTDDGKDEPSATNTMAHFKDVSDVYASKGPANGGSNDLVLINGVSRQLATAWVAGTSAGPENTVRNTALLAIIKF